MNSTVSKVYNCLKNYDVIIDNEYWIECCFVIERTPKYSSCLRLVITKSMRYLCNRF